MELKEQMTKANFEKYIRGPLSKAFRTEDSRFKLMVAVKITILPIFVSFFLLYMFWILIEMNLIFFEANGFYGIKELQDAYYEFIFNEISSTIPWIGLYIVVLFLTGLYLGELLLRPFKIIGQYCEETMEDPNVSYEPDTFSDYKLLTRFSEFFFAYANHGRRVGKLEPNTIPPAFTKIHRPVFDKIFFFHYMLYLTIVTLCTLAFLLNISSDTHESIVALAIKSLKLAGKNSTYFLQEQSSIYGSMVWVSTLIVVIGYVMLAFHLYNKVAGAAFGFFTTMRSFMKGSFDNRVHLLDFNHIRPYSRSFNKYLDYLQRNFINKDKKVENN